MPALKTLGAALVAGTWLLTLFPAHADPTDFPSLNIAITGARPAGTIKLALFATAPAFETRTGPAATLDIVPDTNGQAQAAVRLPPGQYALATYQDLDGDGRLGTNFLGLPTEPFGFSGTENTFGPPSFAEATFRHPLPETLLVELHSF